MNIVDLAHRRRLLSSGQALAWFIIAAANVAPVAAASKPGEDLFTDTHVTRLEVEVSPEDMARLAKTQKFKGLGERPDYAVVVQEGNRVYTNVAMHLKGAIGSFRPIDDKPALTLSFDKLISGQNFHGLIKIQLNNSVQDSIFISEKLSRELFARAGIAAPRVGYATVSINGRDLGFYLIVESYNRQFLKQHFKNTTGNLYDGGLGEEINTGGKQAFNSGDHPEDQSELKTLVDTANEPDFEKRLQRLEMVLDLDRFITHTALDAMLHNWDGYGRNRNNYRLFHDRDSGRLVFLPHGLDMTFQNPEVTIVPRMEGLIAKSVMATPAGRQRYLEKMSMMLTNLFETAALTNRVLQLAATVRPELTRRNPQFAAEFDDGVAMYCASIAQRVLSIQHQLSSVLHPVKFDGASTIRLTDLKSWTEFGRPEFAQSAASAAALRISAKKGPAIGWWSKKLWLEQGKYRLEGAVCTQGVVAEPTDHRGGAGLRVAGRRLATRLVGTKNWTPVSYEFEVTDPLYEIELICELRAAKGEVWFDADSLRVVRR